MSLAFHHNNYNYVLNSSFYSVRVMQQYSVKIIQRLTAVYTYFVLSRFSLIQILCEDASDDMVEQ